MTLITTLNYREEEVASLAMKNQAQKKCTHLVRLLTECTATKTITIYWPWSACEEQRKVMSKCLALYTSPEVKEQLREEVMDRKVKYLREHGKLPQS